MHHWHLDTQMLMTGEPPRHWQGDGIITSLGGDLKHVKRLLSESTCPAVSLSLNHPEIEIPRVGINNEKVGALAANHFLERGFSSFAFYGRVSSHASELRSQAFARHIATAGHGVTALFSHRQTTPVEESWENRQKVLCKQLQALPKPLAVFCHDDSSGVEIIEACQRSGFVIPHQVAVLGVLDIPLFRESTTIPLSSIPVDFDNHARIACDLLADILEGKKPPSKPLLLEPTRIITRQSTDTIAATTAEVARAIHCMKARFSDPLVIDDIAEAVGLTHTRFYQAFKRDLGRSPGSVLTHIRLEKAKKMLRETKGQVDAIAAACGFGDRINLHRNFKRHLTTTPATYRRDNVE